MDVKDLLIDYINGGLSEEETRQVRDSLAADEELRQEFEALRNDQHAVQKTFDDASDASHANIASAVKQRLAQERNARSSYGISALLATAAALICALLISLQARMTPANSNAEMDPGVSLVLSTEDPNVTIYWTIEAE